ncbi:4-hydroxy-3-methylbut-2-enyl diphosphate reductase [Elusimicrobiota bacterium]
MSDKPGTQKILYVVSPRGWCAGVKRAIGVLEKALEKSKDQIYVRHEIVHNKAVVESFKKMGVIFADNIEAVPEESLIIFSAHGAAPGVYKQAEIKNLKIIDATCPLVTKVHTEVRNFAKKGYHILYIGHKKHEEAVGVYGENPENISIIETETDARKWQAPDKFSKAQFCVLTQTTLSIIDAQKIIAVLKERFPEIILPKREDICYATTNRQNAVRSLVNTKRIGMLYVIGSKNSSNSNRLREVSESIGVKAKLIDSETDIIPEDFLKAQRIGLTAGASAPEDIVERVSAYFTKAGYTTEEVSFADENVSFALPREIYNL